MRNNLKAPMVAAYLGCQVQTYLVVKGYYTFQNEGVYKDTEWS